MRGYLETKLDMLEARGVTIVDRRQAYLDDAVDVSRVSCGAVLFPGARLLGAQTFVGPGAKVGIEGPAVLENAMIGENAVVASGYLHEAVMLRDSRVGANAHIRSGTLLEEEASTAHAVGLKQTILMSFVTMGSLINFCDALISGGTSRRDHSEIGSGSIHFNFTPHGRQGDKATPSLLGDVVHGVFLREPPIFFGGLSGIVGPQRVGFGSLTVAGQILRREVAPGRIVGDVARKVDKRFERTREVSDRIMRYNLEYIGNLVALREWYRAVRLPRIPNLALYDHLRIVTQAGCELLSCCIDERMKRLREYLEERSVPMLSLSFATPPCPLNVNPEDPYVDQVNWVKGLSDDEVASGVAWLQNIVQNVVFAARFV